MRTQKRIISLLLAVVMIFGSLGNSIIAETIPSETPTGTMPTETFLGTEASQPQEGQSTPTEPTMNLPVPSEPVTASDPVPMTSEAM